MNRIELLAHFSFSPSRSALALTENIHTAETLGPLWVCAVTKAALSSGCKSHPANAPAGSNRSSHGGNEVAEALD